jgi:hypothetical protein
MRLLPKCECVPCASPLLHLCSSNQQVSRHKSIVCCSSALNEACVCFLSSVCRIQFWFYIFNSHDRPCFHFQLRFRGDMLGADIIPNELSLDQSSVGRIPFILFFLLHWDLVLPQLPDPFCCTGFQYFLSSLIFSTALSSNTSSAPSSFLLN